MSDHVMDVKALFEIISMLPNVESHVLCISRIVELGSVAIDLDTRS